LPTSQVLPLLSEMEVRLGAWMPFERVAEFLAETVKAKRSKATVHRETVKAGQAMVDAETKANEWLSKTVPESDGPAVAHQQISVDGAMVPLIGRWAEVKTVAIGTIVATEAGPKARDLSYFSRKADHSTFSQQATLETHRRATHKAEKVTAVVDGADWIQDFLDLQCPGAVRIIDWAHSSSYVAKAAQALFPDPGEAADWRGAQLNLLLHGDPQGVLDELCIQLGVAAAWARTRSRWSQPALATLPSASIRFSTASTGRPASRLGVALSKVRTKSLSNSDLRVPECAGRASTLTPCSPCATPSAAQGAGQIPGASSMPFGVASLPNVHRPHITPVILFPFPRRGSQSAGPGPLATSRSSAPAPAQNYETHPPCLARRGPMIY